MHVSASSNGAKPLLLEVKDLEAKIVETGQQILNGVSLTIRQGEVHAIMGKNGSGKSTLSKVLVGHPDYEVTGGTAMYKGKNLFDLEPEERSHEGLFLSFQSPIEIPGVSNVDFLRMACNARRKALGQAELDPLEFYAHVIPKVRPGRGAGRARPRTAAARPQTPTTAAAASSSSSGNCGSWCMHVQPIDGARSVVGRMCLAAVVSVLRQLLCLTPAAATAAVCAGRRSRWHQLDALPRKQHGVAHL